MWQILLQKSASRGATRLKRFLECRMPSARLGAAGLAGGTKDGGVKQEMRWPLVVA